MDIQILRNTLFKSLRMMQMNYFFQGRRPGQLYILIFHRINNDNCPFYPAVPVSAFRQICRFISRGKFGVIHFSEIGDYFKKTTKPAFIITFDDGYYELLKNAYPILKEYKLKFNLNIPTECLQTHLPPYNVAVYDVLNITEKKEYVINSIFSEPLKIKIDRSAPQKTEAEFRKLFRGLTREQNRLIANDMIRKLTGGLTEASRMLSKEDVIFLNRNGAEIGSHTHSHSLLVNLDIPEVEFELRRSKEILEDLCGDKIDIIAFPQGWTNEAIIQKSLEAGYKHLLLTGDRRNAVQDKGNLFNRFGLYYKTADEALAKIFGFHQAISNFASI